MSDKPKIAVIAVGSAATQVMIDLIPEMPDAKFVSYLGLGQSMKINSQTTSDTAKYKNKFRKHLKYRMYPPSNVPDNDPLVTMFLGVSSWRGKRIRKGDEIWYWESCRYLAGGGGAAHVRNGNVIDVLVTFIS